MHKHQPYSAHRVLLLTANQMYKLTSEQKLIKSAILSKEAVI